MTLIKTNFNYSGRFGGTYFHRDSSGLHINAMPRHVKYAHSPSQMIGVSGFSACSAIWMWLLALGILIFWKIFSDEAEEHGIIDGHPPLTSWNYFTKYNVMRLGRNLPPITFPPKHTNEMPVLIGVGGFQTPVSFNYYPYGEFNGRPCYEMDCQRFSWQGEPSTKIWYLWWSGEFWYLTNKTGVIPSTLYFINFGVHPVGEYVPVPFGNHHHIFYY